VEAEIEVGACRQDCPCRHKQKQEFDRCSGPSFPALSAGWNAADPQCVHLVCDGFSTAT
jgi:hypothetical protein